ncbi:hypothetical protein Tco_0735056, partial [Tanacetum coccineum]
MNPIATQQAALDNVLVPPENRLKIERCNARIVFKHLCKLKSQEQGILLLFQVWYIGFTPLVVTSNSLQRDFKYMCAQCVADSEILVPLHRRMECGPPISNASQKAVASGNLSNMNPIATQQAALDNALVPPEKRLKIERCNARIAFSKPQREETYQVTLDALKLSPCYPAFQITVEVPKIYMHQFWTTIKKIGNSDAYNFKLEKKKCRVDTEVFREILQICPRILNQDFIAPPSEEELVTFIQELGYSGKCNMLSAIHTDQMHQPWRTFAAIINRCISGKTTGLDRLRESRAQILWGMYNKKNVDYVALLWEDFMYQADNREISSACKEHMPYLRFTKVIINHFISKDKKISLRNRINLHT